MKKSVLIALFVLASTAYGNSFNHSTCEIHLPLADEISGQANYYSTASRILSSKGYIVHSNETESELNFSWGARRMGRSKRLINVAILRKTSAGMRVISREATRGRAKNFYTALRDLPSCQTI